MGRRTRSDAVDVEHLVGGRTKVDRDGVRQVIAVSDMRGLDQRGRTERIELSLVVDREDVAERLTVRRGGGNGFEGDKFDFIITCGSIDQVAGAELEELTFGDSGRGRKRKIACLATVVVAWRKSDMFRV